MKTSVATTGAIQVLDVLEALGHLGIDRRRLCVAADLDMDALRSPDVRVPTATVVRLLDEAERVSGDHLVGLHAGACAEPRGALLYLFMSSPRLEDGLRQVARFSRAAIDTLQITVDVRADRANLVLAPGDAEVEGSHHAVEYLLMAMLRTMRRVIDPAIEVVEVHFRHPQPGGAGDILDVVGCPVRFQQTDHRIVFAVQAMAATSPFANQRIAAYLEKFATIATPAATVSGRVANVVRQLLATTRPVDARTVGRQIGMSERTMQRSLREERSTFREVRDAAVRELVDALLLNRQLKLEAIARSAGFADAPALAKAIKRWAGCSPTEYRDRLVHPPTGSRRKARRAT